MKRIKLAAGLAVILALVLTLGCAEQAAKRAGKPGFDRAGMFRALDDNKDGRISREEYYRVYEDMDTARRTFSEYDADGDGYLGEDEFHLPGITIFKW